MLKVAKFGGSSLADATQFKKVQEIVSRDPARKVVVVSAPGKRFAKDHKLTDLLYLCHAHITYGVDCTPVFSLIKERFYSIRDELGLSVPLESEFAALEEEMRNGISEAKLVSRGEYFAAKLLAAFLGFEFIDAKELITFRFDGAVDSEKTYAFIREKVRGKNAVIPGFYGVMPDGFISLMSRGGSDVTGALLAAALDAAVYENWTDVPGILMADPRIVHDERPIPEITYLELRELSYIGAKVLHENSVFPVREKNIPLNIRNTNDPDHPGTVIRESFDEDETDNENSNFITGIAGKTGLTVITVIKSGLSSMVGAFRQILGFFAKYNISVAYTCGGIDCYSVIVETKHLEPVRYRILSELETEMTPDKMNVSDGLAVVAVVGRKMVLRVGCCGKILATLGNADVNIRMITAGPEEMNVIVGVDEKDFARSVQVLYEEFK